MGRNTTFICSLAGAGLLACGGVALAADWEDDSAYYEDDGWLDITEWFDGNDYNPTDETWWQWDDERYDAADDTGADKDSDVWYGYSGQRGDDDWFYDYYDPYSNYGSAANDLYTYGSRYYDYDNDGSYDASVWYSDSDGDGLYDHYNYYTYSDTGSQKQRDRAKAEAPKSSKAYSVYGTVQKVKDVQTRGETHTVVAIQTQEQDKAVTVDLGRTSDVNTFDLKSGDQLTAKGPMTKVGDQNVLIAHSFESGGKTHEVDRNRKEITATVLSTHRAQVRGKENLIAMVEGPNKNKMAVDLGPADKLGMSVAKGASLTFTGVPVKVHDKRLIMAHSVTKDGKRMSIDRQTKMASSGTKSDMR